MFVLCECCVLSGRGLCDELITHPEEFYWLVRHCVWSRKPQEWGGHDPCWVAAPQKKMRVKHDCVFQFSRSTYQNTRLSSLHSMIARAVWPYVANQV
jgi:hypothetical protein